VALVTGASSGLGQATAVALARAGADVGLLARDTAALDETAAGVRAAGRRAAVVACDLADGGSVRSAAATVMRELGGLHVLVCAAGTDAPGPVAELDPAGWERTLAVNLTAPFLLVREAWRSMAEAGGGTIVLVSSVAGRRGWAGAAAYCATKFALTGLAQALKAEGAESGIRTCVLYPGAMATAWGSFTPDVRRAADESTETAPAQALPPADVAELIAWIAAAPRELVLDEAIVTPLHEQGWP
jgi:NAD(P)-dependent dehydrogenase (short-subunit alcohol dehydrogenase family)